MTTTALDTVDGPLVIETNAATGRPCTLATQIEGSVLAATPAELGPALNALYAAALAAIQVDPTVGQLAIDVRERDASEGEALTVAITRERLTQCSARFTLHVACDYFQSYGALDRRQPLYEAIRAAALAAIPTTDPPVVEQCLVALQSRLSTALGVTVRRNADREVRVPAWVLVDGDQFADHANHGRTRYARQFAVEVFALTDADLDVAVQGALAGIYQAGVDRLGGLADDVQASEADPTTIREEYTGPGRVARIEGTVWCCTAVGDPWTVA